MVPQDGLGDLCIGTDVYETVVEACVDFERRMPKCGPPMLTSLAWSEDGRDEGSKYPNLMMSKARERYGI